MKSTAAVRPLAAGMAAVAAAGIVAGALLETGLPAPASQWAFIAIALFLPALGWLIAARRPDNAYGWLLLAAADCLGLGGLGIGLLTRLGPDPYWPIVAATVLSSLFPVFYGLSWVFVPLLFPDGRLPSRRWRVVAVTAAVAIAGHWLAVLFVPGPYLEGVAHANPLGLRGPLGLVAGLTALVGQVVTFLLALVVLGGILARLRRSRPPERARLGWMAAGLLANLSASVVITVAGASQSYGVADIVGVLGVVGALPAAIGAAVLRHDLLDIRVGVKGSRLYLVFDVRPTVDELLSRLGPDLEEAKPVEQLGRLAQAVRAGLDARWAAVELGDGTRVVAGEERGDAVLTVPAGLGRITCGPKAAGRLTRDDRRRIERNIHDGVQQQLVALIAGLELARALQASVTDDGTGFDLRAVARRGLATLADRMAALGGGLETTAGPGEGTRVRAWVTADA